MEAGHPVTAQRLAGHCGTCGAPLRAETRTNTCAECRWFERDRKLRAIDEAQRRRQRAAVVAQRISLVAVVVEASWHGANHRRLVACPWCGGEHSHPLRHVGLVRPSGCLKGFYEIKREDEEP